MSITVYTGYPGAGKSYGLVSEVIVPAVLKGRRVLTNVDGLDPAKVMDFCAAKVDDRSVLGSVVLFDGADATKPGFFPHESQPDDATVVKGGDLLVFDEWRLYFPKRGRLASDDVEKFLRWHRHLVDAQGRSTDVAIGTQAATDIHMDFRALVERNFKFNKLRSLGLAKHYAWFAWNGAHQPKGEHYAHGTAKYEAEYFPLYESYKGGTGLELKTGKRDSIWSQPKTWFAIVAPILLLLGGGIGLYRAFSADYAAAGSAAAQGAVGAPAPSSPAVASSPWRIVGVIVGENGTRVIVADDKGVVRMMPPTGFTFEEGRPVSGVVDGATAFAEDRLPTSAPASPFMGALQ